MVERFGGAQEENIRINLRTQIGINAESSGVIKNGDKGCRLETLQRDVDYLMVQL